MSISTTSTNRTTHLLTSACESHTVGRRAEEDRATPRLREKVAPPRPHLAHVLDRSGAPAEDIRGLPAHSHSRMHARGRVAVETENRKLRALLIQEAERRHETEQRRSIAESLGDEMSMLNAERPLGDVLAYIALEAKQLFRSQVAAVYQSGHETEAVCSLAHHGPASFTATSNHIDVQHDVLRQTILSRDAFAFDDVPSALVDVARRAPAAVPPAFIIPVMAGCSALLAVPILVKGEVFGGLVLYDAVPRHFSHEEIELANMFADQAALVIESARLRQQAAEEAATAAAALERDRLARDLHDAVTQAIFSANLMAEALPRVWERNPCEGQRGLAQLHLLTRGALAEMRTLLFELRPTALLDKPLPELLRQLTEAMATRSDACATFEAEGTCALPPPVQVAIYRIAQEALNNVAKHAAARTVRVALQCSPQRVVLRIRDDGRGFEAHKVTADHFGIAIMRERAKPIGATCTVRSHLGKGTQVTVVWPATTAACINHSQSVLVDPLFAQEIAHEHGTQGKQVYTHVEKPARVPRRHAHV